MMQELSFGQFLQKAKNNCGKSWQGISDGLAARGHRINRSTLWRWSQGGKYPQRDKLPVLQHLPSVLELDSDETAVYHNIIKQLIGVSAGLPKKHTPSHFFNDKTIHLIGRRRELKEAQTAVSSHQLLLITGLAGVGKTTLARKLLQAEKHHFSTRLGFMQLSSGDEISDVVSELIQLLQLSVTQEMVTHNLNQTLRQIKSLTHGWCYLLLLDNVESATQITPLLPFIPSLTVVITSRTKLIFPQLDVHQLWLQPPALADAAKIIMHNAGVGRTEELPARKIADRLSSLPIALKMAGLFVKNGRFPTLSHLHHWLVEKEIKDIQTNDWSLTQYLDEMLDLLTNQMQTVFMLCGAFTSPRIRTNHLTKLMEKSDLPVDTMGQLATFSILEWGEDGEIITLHPLIHEYAAHRLAQSNQKEAILTAFNASMAEWAAAHREQAIVLHHQLPNLFAAADIAYQSSDWKNLKLLWGPITGCLWTYSRWDAYHAFNEKCRQIAQQHQDEVAVARTNVCIAWACLEKQEYKLAEQLLLDAQAQYDLLGMDQARIDTRRSLGILYTEQGSLELAEKLLNEARKIVQQCSQQTSPPFATTRYLMLLSHAQAGIEIQKRAYPIALKHSLDAFDKYQQVQESRFISMIQLRLGDILYRMGQLQKAVAYWQQVYTVSDKYHAEVRLVAGAAMRLAQNDSYYEDGAKRSTYIAQAREIYEDAGLLAKTKQLDKLAATINNWLEHSSPSERSLPDFELWD